MLHGTQGATLNNLIRTSLLFNVLSVGILTFGRFEKSFPVVKDFLPFCTKFRFFTFLYSSPLMLTASLDILSPSSSLLLSLLPFESKEIHGIRKVKSSWRSKSNGLKYKICQKALKVCISTTWNLRRQVVCPKNKLFVKKLEPGNKLFVWKLEPGSQSILKVLEFHRMLLLQEKCYIGNEKVFSPSQVSGWNMRKCFHLKC